MRSDTERFCTQCGHVGDPRERVPGSLLVELILWVLLIVPGLIYTAWRRSKAHDVCERCGSAQLVPIDTPVAQAFLRNNPPPPAPVQPVRRPSRNAYRVGGAIGKGVARVFGWLRPGRR